MAGKVLEESAGVSLSAFGGGSSRFDVEEI